MRVLNLRGGPRLIAAGSSVLLAASGLTLTAVVSAAPASASVGQVAPYVDMSNSQESVLNTAISSHGLRSFTAAFTIGQGCNDIWGDTLPVGAYQTIINDYGTSQLDFDIEGAAIADTAGIDRTFQAMKDLKAANPALTWSVTVPVLPTGLDYNGAALLQDARNMGVTIPLVNIM